MLLVAVYRRALSCRCYARNRAAIDGGTSIEDCQVRCSDGSLTHKCASFWRNMRVTAAKCTIVWPSKAAPYKPMPVFACRHCRETVVEDDGDVIDRHVIRCFREHLLGCPAALRAASPALPVTHSREELLNHFKLRQRRDRAR